MYENPAFKMLLCNFFIYFWIIKKYLLKFWPIVMVINIIFLRFWWLQIVQIHWILRWCVRVVWIVKLSSVCQTWKDEPTSSKSMPGLWALRETSASIYSQDFVLILPALKLGKPVVISTSHFSTMCLRLLLISDPYVPRLVCLQSELGGRWPLKRISLKLLTKLLNPTPSSPLHLDIWLIIK